MNYKQELQNYIKIKNNPMADSRSLYEKRERILYWDTSIMSDEEKRLLSEALG